MKRAWKKKRETRIQSSCLHHLTEYYSKYNFVVDSSGCLYYFQQDKAIIPGCSYGIVFDSIYPAKFIGLRPEKLIKIPSATVEEFVRENILPDTTRFNLNFIP